MFRRENHQEWLEAVLAEHLRPVAAPPDLWARIQNRRHLRPAGLSTWQFASAMAAGLLVVASVFGSYERPGLAANEALADQALSGSVKLNLQSDQPQQIRNWVKANTGIDIPLVPEPASSIRMTGTCTIRSAVAVAYRAGDSDATLVVARDGHASGTAHKHKFLSTQTRNGGSVSSWTMDGKLYTLAYTSAKDLHAACGICHTDQEATVLN